MNRDSVTSTSRESGTLLALSAFVAFGAAISTQWSPADFEPYFGGLNPLVAFGLVLFLAGLSLRYLASSDWLMILKRPVTSDRFVKVCSLATLLAFVMIGADTVLRLPTDINVPPPQALLFYPVMAYVAESAFHVIPLGVLLLFLTCFDLPEAKRRSALVACMIVVSVFEPVFQVLPSVAGPQPVLTTAFVSVHVLVFNLFALGLFFRYDFITTYVFRIVYYLVWHIIWGYARLSLLF